MQEVVSEDPDVLVGVVSEAWLVLGHDQEVQVLGIVVIQHVVVLWLSEDGVGQLQFEVWQCVVHLSGHSTGYPHVVVLDKLERSCSRSVLKLLSELFVSTSWKNHETGALIKHSHGVCLSIIETTDVHIFTVDIDGGFHQLDTPLKCFAA